MKERKLPAADLLIRGASELLTCDESTGAGPEGRVPRGAVAIGGERILAVGR